MHTLTTKTLAKQLGITERGVQKKTKNALARNTRVVAWGDRAFSVTKIKGVSRDGLTYSYAPVVVTTPTKQKKRVPATSVCCATDVPKIVDIAKPTHDEKLAIVGFCAKTKLSYRCAAQALILANQAGKAIKRASLARNLRRWNDTFVKNGATALADTRCGKHSKIDTSLIKKSIYAGGNRHHLTLYNYYCYLYAKRRGLAIDIKKPQADIHYTTFVREIEKLKRDDQHIKTFLQQGMDAFTYAEPSIGRNFDYQNQQWEMDATKQDVMVKVPMADMTAKNTGYRDYCHRNPSDNYQLVRMQLIGIIDNCTGAAVYGLYSTSNYYGNMRLVYKAMALLGKPEMIKGDNGKDYISHNFQQLLLDLGIIYIATNKGRGDQKGKVERSFKTLQHSPAFESLAGFIGHSVDQRQHIENEASTKLERLSGVATNAKGDYLWWWELENWIDNYVRECHADRYAQHSPATASWLAKIYPYLGKRSTRKVSKNGIAHQGKYYLSIDFWHKVTIGDTLEIAEDINDSNRLFVFTSNKLLCEVFERGELRKGLSVEQIKQVKKAYKQRVVKQDKQLAKQAQKDYGYYQNAVRDAFIDEQTKVTKAKRTLKKRQENQDFNALAELVKLAQKTG